MFFFNTKLELAKRKEHKINGHHIGKQLHLLLYIRRYMIEVLNVFYIDEVVSLP